MSTYLCKADDRNAIPPGLTWEHVVPKTEARMSIPAAIGHGVVRWVQLPNGISAMLSRSEFVSGLMLNRQPGVGDFFILQFDCVDNSHKFTADAMGRARQTSSRLAGSYLCKPDSCPQQLREKGTQAQSVKFIITHQWLQEFFPDAVATAEKILREHSGGVFTLPMPREQQVLLEAIAGCAETSGKGQFFLQNRLLLLLEKYFTLLCRRETDGGGAIRQPEYVSRVMQTARLLEEHVENKAPSVTQLARLAVMSPTSYKKYFKAIYGLPVYRYYLKLRLQHARNLLLNRGYLVNEVACKTGYGSAKQFESAYIKEFGETPYSKNTTV